MSATQANKCLPLRCSDTVFQRPYNQWSDLAILLFAKNADDENEKCLKIRVFLCISHSKLEKGYPFFNFHSPLRKPEKGAFFLMKSRIFLGFVFDMN